MASNTPDRVTIRQRWRVALAYGGVMLVAALVFCWTFRNQYAHALPPAFFIACPTSALIAAALGWLLAPIQGRSGWFIALVSPLAVVGATVSAAAILYAALLILWLHYPQWDDDYFTPWQSLLHETGRLFEYAFFYAAMTSLIWFPGMLAATLWLEWRARRSSG
ncbi:MAG: hypothetical protein KDI56_02390 [Xanthomonadales bacterium]|nr:hypothetical protein [Xanthomonadales bacterium]